MRATQELDFNVHEYRFHWFWIGMYLIFGLLSAAPACFIIFVLATSLESGSTTQPSDAFIYIFAMIASLIFGYFFLSLAFRSKLTIHGDRIEVRYAFSDKSVTLNELDGYREVTSKNANFTVLYRKSGNKAMAINHAFKTDDFYKQWIDRLRNLDNLSITPNWNN